MADDGDRRAGGADQVPASCAARARTASRCSAACPTPRAPVGELRFQPPQPVPAWRGVRDATKDGPIAPQGRSRLAHVMGDFERPQSEDCLTLNVWTPAADAKKRPVLVWIHGGAFSSGAGSLPWYSGERLAANGDIVAVSINYRLGALGFLCLPGISDGNLGLLDQVAALRFVRDNIAAFGGDPDNVTVVGPVGGRGFDRDPDDHATGRAACSGARSCKARRSAAWRARSRMRTGSDGACWMCWA